MFLAVVATWAVLIILRLWTIVPGRHRSPPLKRRQGTCKTLIFVGSGGHTAEMMTLVQSLDSGVYQPRTYVIAQTDLLSESKVKAIDANAIIYRLPRGREIGQRWRSVPWAMARALVVAIQIEVKTRPELIVCNGPGSCIPVCAAAYLASLVGIRRPQIVYVESFARVKSLSVTGKLLYMFADRFIVQWPELARAYAKAEYHGLLA